MTKKYYYDTGAFWRFFINEYIEKNELPEDLKRYSPLNQESNINRKISPWTVEEFFYAFTASKRKEIKFPKNLKFPNKFFEKEIEKRTNILANIKSFVYLFSQDIVDTRVVNEIFLSLIFAAKNNQILSYKKNDKKINSKDLLHLAYALFFKCHAVITCDKGFTLLKDVEIIKRMLYQYKLKEIIIIDTELTKIEQKIIL